MSEIRDKKTKEKFIKYLKDHPEERFWQAIRNFSKYEFILGYNGNFENIPVGFRDTFYIESDTEK